MSGLLMSVLTIMSIACSCYAANEIELLNAAHRGDIDYVRGLLGSCSHIEVNKMIVAEWWLGQSIYMTALMAAAHEGQTHVVIALIELCPDLNLNEGPSGCIALRWAIDGRHVPVVKTLVANPNLSINLADTRLRTSLHQAAMITRSSELVNALLTRADLDVNAKDFEGHTALMLATRLHRHDIIRSLLTSDLIRTDLSDPNGKGVFTFAAGNVATMNALSDLSLYNVNGGNSDDERSFLFAVRRHQTDRVADLMQRVNINAVNSNGWTALMIASYRGFFAIVDLLLHREELKMNYWLDRDGVRRSALTLAIETHRPNIVAKMINSRHYLHLNRTDSTGKTPMEFARTLRNEQIIKLIAAHIDLQRTVVSNLDIVLHAKMQSVDPSTFHGQIAQFLLGVK